MSLDQIKSSSSKNRYLADTVSPSLTKNDYLQSQINSYKNNIEQMFKENLKREEEKRIKSSQQREQTPFIHDVIRKQSPYLSE